MKKESVWQREEWEGKQGRDIGRDVDSLHLQCMSGERDENRSTGKKLTLIDHFSGKI